MNVFKLDSSKYNEILYYMENQNKDSVISISTGEVITKDSEVEIDSEKTYPLPKWGPVEGFRVMNDFVSTLKNPLVKEELIKVLQSGHGVFRKFKNTLKASPESQKLWFSFKRDEMKVTVLNWYNQILEYAGLEILPDESFEDSILLSDDLLGFDFTLRKGEAADYETLKEWDRTAFVELYTNYPPDIAMEIYDRKRDGLINESMFDADFIYVAVTPLNECVGFVWATGYDLGHSYTGMELLQLYVKDEYRGLGIGKMLFEKILEKYRVDKFNDFTLSSSDKNNWIIKYLEMEGYKLAFQELSFKL